MVLFVLQLKADLENVASVELRRNVNLCLSIKNPLSDFEVREKVVMNPSDLVEQEENSRVPDHHLSVAWEGSKKKASTLTILDAAGAKTALKKKKGAVLPRNYTADDSGTFVPLLAVECRGLEPTHFFPMANDEFLVTSAGGKVFTEDVDLSEGDWADYDEENDQPVSISNIEFKWEVA